MCFITMPCGFGMVVLCFDILFLFFFSPLSIVLIYNSFFLLQ